MKDYKNISDEELTCLFILAYKNLIGSKNFNDGKEVIKRYTDDMEDIKEEILRRKLNR